MSGLAYKQVMNNKILILGGGIAGLTTAIALHRKNIDFTVYEAVPEIKAIGSGISLAGNAMRVLEQLQVAEQVKARGHLITSMIIQDEKGHYISALDTRKFTREYGMYNVAIHRGALHEVVLGEIPPARIKTGKKAIGFVEKENTVVLKFDDGTEAEGAAVIVADGIHSAIRKQLLPDSTPRYAGYTCWRGIVENTWGIEDQAVEAWGTTGRIGYVPIGDNKVYWFACKNAPYQDERMKQLSREALRRNFEIFAQPVPQIIEQTPIENIIWNDIVDLKPISRFAFNRLLLIGDAAHATTPNLGQGACLGIEDALAVGELLEHHENPVKAFEVFEQTRLKRAHFIVNTSYRVGKLAQVENRFLARLRNTLFRLLPESVNERQLKQVLAITS
jgi:2-polyprenyl-6-methoxyphenol hydroxylase-like FAD-dependent oxidoreductase